MKVALGIIGIGLSVLVMLQSIVFDGVDSLIQEEVLYAGSVGVLVAFLIFVAAAFSFRLPLVGGVIFAISGFLAFSISAIFPDMAFWGSTSLILGTLAGFSGWKERVASRGVRND